MARGVKFNAPFIWALKKWRYGRILILMREEKHFTLLAARKKNGTYLLLRLCSTD
jgi:hypothetical protein